MIYSLGSHFTGSRRGGWRGYSWWWCGKGEWNEYCGRRGCNWYSGRQQRQGSFGRWDWRRTVLRRFCYFVLILAKLVFSYLICSGSILARDSRVDDRCCCCCRGWVFGQKKGRDSIEGLIEAFSLRCSYAWWVSLNWSCRCFFVLLFVLSVILFVFYSCFVYMGRVSFVFCLFG